MRITLDGKELQLLIEAVKMLRNYYKGAACCLTTEAEREEAEWKCKDIVALLARLR